VPVPLALVVAVAAVPGLLAATAALVAPAALEGRHRTPLLLAAAGAAGTSLAAALPSAALTALVLLPVAVVAGQVALDGVAGTRTRTAADAALPLALGGLAWSVADVTGLAVADRALPVLLVVGALAVLRPRLAVELGATAAALPATLTALAAVAAPPATSVTGSASVSLALHLTLAGALLAASAAMHPSRRLLAWPGGLLLAAATWVRLADLGVSAPEAYTLPTALVLVAVGVVRLRRDADAPTRTTLLPGLVLATLPSLLVVLAEDPVSPRAAALGLGCLVLLLAGARLRWSAPVVVGGAAGAVLVAAELVPYAAVVPQWLLLAAAGAVLTAVGVTWEDRSADARRAARYLVRLR
ncbi:SCO7613 C-terminal domain-containing membrane protein, partial [Nocardioides aquaticus]|uniref:SCO7613 C-terminal domain-containing membrane protein n=1 Tax=Nocardioides aquaticus TaxID=160826 RepID=UPI0031CFFB55